MTAQEARKMTNAFRPKSYLNQILCEINVTAREGGSCIYSYGSNEDIKDLEELGYKVLRNSVDILDKNAKDVTLERGIIPIRINW